MADHTIKQGNTSILELARLFDRVEAEYPDPDAVAVTASLADSTGTPVTGASSLPCEHVTGTHGSRTLYRCTLAHTLPLTIDDEYTLTVTAVVTTDDGEAQFKAVDTVVVEQG